MKKNKQVKQMMYDTCGAKWFRYYNWSKGIYCITIDTTFFVVSIKASELPKCKK